MRYFALLLLALTGSLLPLPAADWPCWRGPDGLGVSREKDLPVSWSRDRNIAWQVELPGKGASSPIVAADRVYLTTQTEDSGLHVLAFDRASGRLLWDREIGRGRLHANSLHNMATPTPISDGANIWALFGTGDLACLDLAGKVIWSRNLVKEYGQFKTNHGYGSSPMLEAAKLFVVCMHQGPSYVLAIDAKTGKNLWRKDRDLGLTDEAQDSYSSPLFLPAKGQTPLVLEGAENHRQRALAWRRLEGAPPRRTYDLGTDSRRRCSTRRRLRLPKPRLHGRILTGRKRWRRPQALDADQILPGLSYSRDLRG